MTSPDTTLNTAPDSRLGRAAAHLYGAVALADTNALAGGDDLLSAWTNTALKASIAAGYLRMHLPGVVSPQSHPGCADALRAALTDIALLQPDVDLPPRDLADAMDYAVQALQLAQPPLDAAPPASSGPAASAAGSAGWSA